MFLNINSFLCLKIHKTIRRIINITEIVVAVFNPGIEYSNEIECSPDETLIPSSASEILIRLSSFTFLPSTYTLQPLSYGIEVNNISLFSAIKVPSISVSLNLVYSI